jgi:thioredoxin reductase
MENYNAVIVGGGAAGLSAAMVLARANRRVLVIDAGKQSNRVSREAHGVFTRDKVPPQELYQIAREQVLHYPVAAIKDGQVVAIQKQKENEFIVTLESGEQVQAKAIVLAQGVKHILLPIEGIQELWGTKVWSCPFCEGYEASGKKLIGIVEKEKVPHKRDLLANWTKDITFVMPEDVQKISSTDSGVLVTMKDGSELEAEEVVTQSTTAPRDELAESLGCARLDTCHLILDDTGKTSVDGVYAAGDQSSEMAQVNLAIAAGHLAGSSIVLHVSR